jgi:hypothetical protein
MLSREHAVDHARSATCRRLPRRDTTPAMRTLIATVFNDSLDGFLADPGTAFWD